MAGCSTLGYLPWKPDPRPSTRPRDFFTKLIKPRDRRLFYGFWLQKAGVSVAADTTNTQHKCKLPRRLQIEQRRSAAQRKGGQPNLSSSLSPPCSNFSNGRCSHFSLERVRFPPLLTCPKLHSAHSTGVLHRLRDFPGRNLHGLDFSRDCVVCGKLLVHAPA